VRVVLFVPELSLVTCDCRCHSLSLSLADERELLEVAGQGGGGQRGAGGVWEAKFGGAGEELLWVGMHHKFTWPCLVPKFFPKFYYIKRRFPITSKCR
jgi:hypothetical protein